ncbi:cilia- and flagella-associated protein 161-like isoform X1 [Daktulosphaira vitifoliae]|uniref:cilia- and flagella-associated protein 161-like isoform X1 n=1 Tax=Daktulosphaira vitifoliae TaxID=58002 RepID=UPI0021AAB8D6|nr:cilia- and flagella-associated protein 161-like isoform X1 [Daktulosphaira vitifoliae]
MNNLKKYSVNVREGNWVEETFLQGEIVRSFLEKKDKGELLIQKTRKMYASLLKPMTLSSSNEYIKYGEFTQLICPNILKVCKSGVSLSCSVGGTALDEQELGLRFLLTGSPFIEPCVRNCFKILGFESGCDDGKPVKFGDTFAITPCVSSKPLYVCVEMPRLSVEQGLSNHPVLKLTDTLDVYCRWRVNYWKKNLQMEAEGLPIPNGTCVLLNHSSTNQNVAVETKFLLDTFFGKEYEVTAHSYKGIRGCDKPENLWQFITSSHPTKDIQKTNIKS